MAAAGFGDRVEGVHAVTAAAAAGRILELWVEPSRLRHLPIADVIQGLRAAGCPVHELADLRDLAETDSPQGLVARARPLATVSLEQLVSSVDSPGLIVLDHVLDPRNLGAVARSARAAGINGLVVAHRRAAPLSAAAFTAAAGAFEDLSVAMVNSIADALTELGRLGVWTIGLESAAEQSLFGLEILTQPVALVLGEEGSGLSRLVKERCDQLVSIPMASGSESLNVSVAAALAAFEVRRMRAVSEN
jgi:23S rRNA (guanosine2251-2'-O)-methyltransferase